jgi:hypothetical protein
VSEPLAERQLLGYPDASISLSIEDRDYSVVIRDHTGSTVWKPTTKFEAKEMYFHPFVYGYEYPAQNGSNYDGEDGA